MIKTSSLTPKALEVIKNKATEPPHTGKYNNYNKDIIGTYLCKQCGLALFRSNDKFTSSCGWPSFDVQIDSNVKKVIDSDGIRTEILCARCSAHLGHVFSGEQFTAKNIRYCVNSCALDFIKHNIIVLDTEEAILAAGCFWGVEYLLKQLAGVLLAEVGYIGGNYNNPNYVAVCNGNTKHVEAVRVIYDSNILTYENLLKMFFEIHDFGQADGQGPDIGEQYLSKIFYYNQQQKLIAEELICYLKNQKFKVATRLQSVAIFWPAEDYHQDYYAKNNKQPYCHKRIAIWK